MKIPPVETSMKIPPVETSMLYDDRRTDGQTDMAKLTVTLRNFMNSPEVRVPEQNDGEYPDLSSD